MCVYVCMYVCVCIFNPNLCISISPSAHIPRPTQCDYCINNNNNTNGYTIPPSHSLQFTGCTVYRHVLARTHVYLGIQCYLSLSLSLYIYIYIYIYIYLNSFIVVCHYHSPMFDINRVSASMMS